jgi:glycosyltransferase involved in cell wall biosynthesis
MRLADMVKTLLVERACYDIAQVDVFSGAAFLWAEISAAILRYLKKPFVLTLHGGDLPKFARRYPNRVKNLLALAKVVIAPSNYLVSEMLPYRKDIMLIPNPINILDYPFQLKSAPRPKLIWLSAFPQFYNPVLAVTVVKELLPDFPSLHMIMIGPDKGDGSYQLTVDQATKLSINDHIDFIPGVPKSEVPLWLNKGDIFLNTTNVDNTPVSVMEAMACGLCVVSTNVGGLPSLIDNEIDGLLVRPNDPVSMANAVRRILLEPGLGPRISQAARNKVACFDWANILPVWDQLLSSLIS